MSNAIKQKCILTLEKTARENIALGRMCGGLRNLDWR